MSQAPGGSSPDVDPGGVGQTRTGARHTGLAAAALALLFLILAGYYAAHKPIAPDNVRAILLTARDLIVAGVLVAIGGGIGRRFVPSPHISQAATLTLQAAYGLGWMGLGALLVGSLGGATPGVAWAGILVLGAAFARSAWSWCMGWRGRVEALAAEGRAAQAAFVLTAVLLALALLEAAAPPVHYDALVYHLELPSRFLAQRSFALVADNPYWGLPLMGEALYAWALALGRLQTAAVLGWMATALTLTGVVGLGSSWAKPAGWVGMLALIGGISLSASPGWAYVDWWAALFAVGMLVALDAHCRAPVRSLALLGGLMAGFACGVKYTAWLVIPAGFLAYWVGQRTRRGLLHAAIFAAAAVVIALPWALKNTLATGAPLYPYLGETEWLLPGRQAAVLASVDRPSVLAGLTAPLAATFLGHEQAPGFASDIGPLLLALLPGLAVLPKHSRARLTPTAVFLLVGWFAWAIASLYSGLLIQTRLYFVLLPAWALLAGSGLAGLEHVRVGNVRFGRIALWLVFLVIGMLTVQQVRQAIDSRPASVVLGEESEEAYLTRRLGTTFLAQQALGSLPADSRVLMLWEPRALYCSPRCLADPWIDRWLLDRRTLESPEAILQAWREDRLTHVLVFETGRAFVEQQDPRYTPGDWEALDRLVQSLTRIEVDGEDYELYKLP